MKPEEYLGYKMKDVWKCPFQDLSQIMLVGLFIKCIRNKELEYGFYKAQLVALLTLFRPFRNWVQEPKSISMLF